MLNFAARGHDLSHVHTIDQLGKKLRENEIHTLQLALGKSFPEIPSDKENINPGMGAYFKEKLSKYDVTIGILSCYINMIHPDKEIREQLLKKFESYLWAAKYFGASMVASETGNVFAEISFTEKNFTDEVFLEAAKVIQRLVTCGEQNKMLVGIEPGLNHPIYSLERTEQLIKIIRSDFLGIILDPTNLINAQTCKQQVELVEEAFQRFGNKIVAVHLKDYQIINGEIVPVNMGEGLIDYQAIAKIISKYRPMSYVVLEETKDRHIMKALQLLA